MSLFSRSRFKSSCLEEHSCSGPRRRPRGKPGLAEGSDSPKALWARCIGAARSTAPRGGFCPPRGNKTCPGLARMTPRSLRTAPPGWDRVPERESGLSEVMWLCQAHGGTSWTQCLLLGRSVGPENCSWQSSSLRCHGRVPRPHACSPSRCWTRTRREITQPGLTS